MTTLHSADFRRRVVHWPCGFNETNRSRLRHFRGRLDYGAIIEVSKDRCGGVCRCVWGAWPGRGAPVDPDVFVLKACGGVHHFWLWTFEYAREHVSVITSPKGIKKLSGGRPLFRAAPGIWGLTGLGLVLLFATVAERGRFFVAGFTVFSCWRSGPAGTSGVIISFNCSRRGIAGGGGISWGFRFFCPVQLCPSPDGVAVPVFYRAAASMLIQWSDIFFLLGPAAGEPRDIWHESISRVGGNRPLSGALIVRRVRALR